MCPSLGAAMSTSISSSSRRKYGKNSSMSSNLSAVRMSALNFLGMMFFMLAGYIKFVCLVESVLFMEIVFCFLKL